MNAPVTLDLSPETCIQQDGTLVLPQRLQWEVAQVLERQGTDYHWTPTAYVPQLAPLHAALLAREKQTAPPHVIAQWLRDMSTAATTNLSAEQLVERIRTTIRVLGGYPAYCWTEATFIAGAKRFKFFPSVAEVEEFHQETIKREQAVIHVTGVLSSERMRQQSLEWQREREETRRYHAEREREIAQRRAEREREMAEAESEDVPF
jgi:hypothetical protein